MKKRTLEQLSEQLADDESVRADIALDRALGHRMIDPDNGHVIRYGGAASPVREIDPSTIAAELPRKREQPTERELLAAEELEISSPRDDADDLFWAGEIGVDEVCEVARLWGDYDEGAE